MIITGRAWKYPDNINTDLIYPGRYLKVTDVHEMKKYAMVGVDMEFAAKVQSGDMIVAGKNFGCGSSREQAAICLKSAGVACIIAESINRIFYRNVVNIGLPVLTTASTSAIRTGDTIEVDFENFTVHDVTIGEVLRAERLPMFIMNIIKDGGLLKHLKNRRVGSN